MANDKRVSKERTPAGPATVLLEGWVLKKKEAGRALEGPKYQKCALSRADTMLRALQTSACATMADVLPTDRLQVASSPNEVFAVFFHGQALLGADYACTHICQVGGRGTANCST
jgi:hypothetical protein